jgi:hypothetical protein
MKLTSSLAFCLVLAPLGLFGQGPATPASVSPSKATDDQEKNIQAYIQLLRMDVRNQKTQLMGVVMNLDANQSAKFWPIYKDFEAELSKFYDGVQGLIKNYAQNYSSMTPAVADKLATSLLDLEQQRNDLRRKYYQRYKTEMDPIIAARFLQVENQFERIIDLEISSQLPVIDR